MGTRTIRGIDLGVEDDRVVALAVIGKLTGEDMAELVARIEAVRESGRKAIVYIDLAEYEGWEPAVATEKLGHLGTLWKGIERLAYVVDKTWMLKMMPLVDAVTPMHIRAFASDEAEEARAWLLSGP